MNIDSMSILIEGLNNLIARKDFEGNEIKKYIYKSPWIFNDLKKNWQLLGQEVILKIDEKKHVFLALTMGHHHICYC